MHHRSLLTSLIALGTFLSACADTLAEVALETTHSAVAEVAKAGIREATGVELKDRGPPTGCLPKNNANCYDAVDREWGEAQNWSRPPTGSIRPPPDCSVCSTLSQPTVLPSPLLNSEPLPAYLLSDACLIDHVRALGVIGSK